MAISAANIEWFYDINKDHRGEYGVWKISDKSWAVVTDDHSTAHPLFKTLTIVSDRQTALGFIKLLKEQ
jgi:hypothetical protein